MQLLKTNHLQQNIVLDSVFVFYIPMHCLVTFCVIITVSRIKGSTVFCNLEFHVLRRENPAENRALNLAYS